MNRKIHLLWLVLFIPQALSSDIEESINVGEEASLYVSSNMNEVRQQACYIVFKNNQLNDKARDQKWFDIKIKQKRALSPKAENIVDKMQLGYGLAIIDIFGAEKALALCNSKGL